MTDDDDPTLLRRYAETRSEAAFAALVQRHLDLVYSAALRRLSGDTHHATDVAQSVFLSLARHAATLARRPVLIGWLYTTTRHAAIDLIRAEQRRRTREHHAHVMDTVNAPAASPADWEQLRPLLDAAMDQLGEREREIVLLRFFENRSFADVGEKLSLTEDAARMRATRALEKLRHLLARHGVTSTAAALSTALAGQTVTAAPAGLALTVTGSALAGAAITSTAALAAGALTLMSTTKTLLAVAGILTAAAIGTAIYEARLAQNANLAAADLQRERDALRTQTATLETRLNETTANLARVTALQKPTEAKSAKPESKPNISLTPSDWMWANPEYGHKYVEEYRAALGLQFGPFYRQLHLSAEQISKFETSLVELQQGLADIWTEAVSRGLSKSDTSVMRLGAEPFQLAETNLRGLLGDSGFEQYRQYDKERGTRDFVTSLAGNVYFTETPLSTVQGEQLARILKANTENKKIPIKDEGSQTVYTLRPETDWTAVNAQAQSLLSPIQLAALKSMSERKRLQTELQRLTSPPPK